MARLCLVLLGLLIPGSRALKCFLSGFTQTFTENELRIQECQTYCVKVSFNSTTRDPFSDHVETKLHEVKYCDNTNECQIHRVPGSGRSRGGCRMVNSADFVASADVDKALDYQLCCCADSNLCNAAAPLTLSPLTLLLSSLTLAALLSPRSV